MQVDSTLYLNRSHTQTLLIDQLCRLVEQVPVNEEIYFASYYLRNFRLCQTLIDAKNRGVKVKILLSGNTHYKNGNFDTIQFLRKNGFDNYSLRLRRPPNLLKKRMHLKLLLISRTGARNNSCLFGSYNPSGNDCVEPEIFRVIGDQDNGYNLMLDISEHPTIYKYLRNYYLSLFKERKRSIRTALLDFGDILFQPSPSTTENELIKLLKSHIERGTLIKVRIAVSHISHRETIQLLAKLRKQGSEVEVLGHDSERRFPKKIEHRLQQSGISVLRYVHPQLLPMHCKMVLIEDSSPVRRRTAFLGSMNLTHKSFYWSDELLVRLTIPSIYDELEGLYEDIRENSERYKKSGLAAP